MARSVALRCSANPCSSSSEADQKARAAPRGVARSLLERQRARDFASQLHLFPHWLLEPAAPPPPPAAAPQAPDACEALRRALRPDPGPDFFYRFACELGAGPFWGAPTQPRRARAGATWHDTRYVLEARHGMHAKVRASEDHRGGSGGSYVTGSLYADVAAEQMDEGYVLRPGDLVVLRRAQMPHYARPYVPSRVAEARRRGERASAAASRPDPGAMSEDERIRLVVADAAHDGYEAPARRAGRRAASDRFAGMHPSRVRHLMEQRPSPDYRCERCHARGEHFQQVCPTRDDPRHVWPRLRPAGIPRR